MNTNTPIRMTEYSHGAGCGCKISPKLLDTLLKSNIQSFDDKNLLVGNASKDDAAVYDIGHGQAVISTTDFFMPIVDDPFTFGQIAATNAISDIYAMGGKPIMAIAIFGWPLDKLPLEVGQQVIDGGREVCHRAGMPLAGGHSIDAPEPIFGLAVTGTVAIDQLKRNDTAQAGDLLFLTKPLGVGILTTAQKQKKLQDAHKDIAINNMLLLNQAGVDFAKMDGVHAMTDVTGFGLGGHLSEVCVGSKLHAEINFDAVPLLPHVLEYLEQGCAPGGAQRNFDSYGHHLNNLSPIQQSILCDPQTSGGLLVCVAPEAEAAFLRGAQEHNLHLAPIGRMVPPETTTTITVR